MTPTTFKRHIAYMGEAGLNAILEKYGSAMVLTLAFYYGRSNSVHKPLEALHLIENVKPGLVSSARDCFGNDARLYFLAGFGAGTAPCANGNDLDEIGDNSEWLDFENLKCTAPVRNEFGFSAARCVKVQG